MLKRFVVAVPVVLLAGCPFKDIPNEERLDRETRKVDSTKTKDFSELMKLRCEELQGAWDKIREEGSEERQLGQYVDLYEELRSRSAEFDKATSRNPDLLYQDNSTELVAAREQCTRMTADVRVEVETKVREIVILPVVDDVRNGKQVKVARLNLERVRDAIERLDLDDKKALLEKLAGAEKTIGPTSPKK